MVNTSPTGCQGLAAGAAVSVLLQRSYCLVGFESVTSRACRS
jgi:hypothetical protein